MDPQTQFHNQNLINQDSQSLFLKDELTRNYDSNYPFLNPISVNNNMNSQSINNHVLFQNFFDNSRPDQNKIPQQNEESQILIPHSNHIEHTNSLFNDNSKNLNSNKLVSQFNQHQFINNNNLNQISQPDINKQESFGKNQQQQFNKNVNNQQTKQEGLSFLNVKQQIQNAAFQGISNNTMSSNNHANSTTNFSAINQQISTLESKKQKKNINHLINKKTKKNNQNFQFNQNNLIQQQIEQQQQNLQNSDNYQTLKFNVKEEDDEEKAKNTRGLRYLSLQVKEIVCEKKRTTYKEVADTLVENLKIQNINSETDEKEIIKDEQNIKRRVYDALNVLIASQVILKKGKQVESCDKSFLKGRCLEKEQWQLVKQKQAEIEEKKFILKQKKLLVHDYIEKTLALKNLIQRNRGKNKQKIVQKDKLSVQKSINSTLDTIMHNENNDNIETELEYDDYDDQDTQDESENRFNFPVTQINFVPSEESIVLKMSRDKKNLRFFSKNSVKIYGDLDILTNFQFHKVSASFMEQNIKPETLKECYYEEYLEAKNLDKENQKTQKKLYNKKIKKSL